MWWRKKSKQVEEIPSEKKLSLDGAVSFVQDILVKNEYDPVFDEAVAGLPGAKERAIQKITDILNGNLVTVEGFTLAQVVVEIYQKAWGLGAVEELYRDPTVDEIRINDYDKVFISRKGKNQRVPVSFSSVEEAKRVIDRLYSHDVGVALTETTPVVESVREDGSRLTALCRPVTDTAVAVLRKRDTFEMTQENLYRTGTLDETVWKVLCFLVRGRANLLIIGGFGSGKSTLQCHLIQVLPAPLRIITLESDRELRLKTHYPDRDIVEIEEHSNLDGTSLKDLLRTTFRLSPDVIIVGEFRGAGEAIESIKACRTLRGSMATAHFTSAEEAVEGTAMFLLEEGLSLPFDLAKVRVARAFNVVVEMFSDTVRGIKKLVKITEVSVQNDTVVFRPLVEWRPETEDYLGPGKWVLLEKPSEELVAKMSWYIPAKREVEALWSTN